MSNSMDQSISDLINVLGDNINLDFSPFSNDFLEEYSATLNTDEAFADVVNSTLYPSDMPAQTPSGFSPENNSNHQESSNLVSQAAALPSNPTSLEIIAQPFYGTKLRYRSDYEKNENRLGVLKNRNKDSSYQGPAIRIPQCYLNPNGEYFIRVSLVTVEYNQTNLHYFHPYELEHPSNEQLNERFRSAVWFVIQKEDCVTGIKSFPTLRIVKKRASDFKSYGNLRVFDCDDENAQNNSLPLFTSAKDTINEYNLDRSQLAFTVGRKVIENGRIIPYLYPDTTVFSEEMIEGVGKEIDSDDSNQSPNERPISSPSICRVYKYAPRYGFAESHEEMVIFLTNKLEPKKYGELKVLFECGIPDGRWSQAVVDFDIKDRMVSFKTPTFPYPFDKTKAVDVILRQDNRIIDTIKYFYLATLDGCSRCQSYAVGNQTNLVPNIPSKRPMYMIHTSDSHYDVFELPPENAPKLQQSLSEPLQESSLSSGNTSTTTSLPSGPVTQMFENPSEEMITKLAASIQSLFIDNDYSPFLRLSRSFLKKSPELIHNAIINNHIDLLLKFIPIASINILQQRNQLGETVLLHAARLNRTEIMKALLERNNADILLEDIDAKDNNIFHIIALNSTSSDILDLVIHHLLSKSIQIHEKFDQSNQDHFTPLQLAITKNNLLVTKYFFKYFNTNVHQTENFTGDNLIHLAVRYGDLTMVKYLIEEGELIEQSKQSNLQMTPSELAQSLKRNDIIQYFNEIYPQQEIDENDSSDED